MNRDDMNYLIRQTICDWTHGGGDIKRDPSGRINWQCRKCGRWADRFVPLEEKRERTDAALRGFRGEKK